MFIEQSVGRRRIVRAAFMLGAVVPCAVLVAAAWWRHSAEYREAVAREVAAHVGVPVSIGSVSHPRPGVRRLANVEIGGAPGRAVLVVPEVEVEVAGEEVRVRASRLECSPESARLLAGIAREWLSVPARFSRAWVVDVAEVTWLFAGGGRLTGDVGWHVECAAAGESRGVWARREPRSTEEIRVRMEGESLHVEGHIEEPLPVSIVAALLGPSGDWVGVFGQQAAMRGRIEAVHEHVRSAWSGSLRGTIERIDLAMIAARGSRGLGGEATIEIDRLRFAGGRLADCDLVLGARGGTISQELLDGLVGNLGCRPGPAYRSIGGEQVRRFDTLGCRLLVEGSDLTVRSIEGDGLIRTQGLNMLEPPIGSAPAARVAWLLSPSGKPAVPATSASAWLISVLPDGGTRTGSF